MAKKMQAVAEVEQVSKPGLGIDEGIVFATFFALLGAVILVYMNMKGYEIPLTK